MQLSKVYKKVLQKFYARAVALQFVDSELPIKGLTPLIRNCRCCRIGRGSLWADALSPWLVGWMVDLPPLFVVDLTPLILLYPLAGSVLWS